MTSFRPANSVESLRAAFDKAFAQPVHAAEATTSILTLRVAGQPCAIERDALSRVMRTPPLTIAPSTHSALLGLCGFEGDVIPVFSLATLQAATGGHIDGGEQWLFIPRGEHLGLAFDVLHRYLTVPTTAIRKEHGDGDSHHRVVVIEEELWELLDISSLLARIPSGASKGS